MKIDQENEKLATEYGIPSLRKKQTQKRYYVLHLRSASWFLQCSVILNCALVVILLYLFFTLKPESYYATAFTGKNTLLQSYPKNEAQLIAMQASQPQQ